MRNRLCLSCLEDWTYSEESMCPACIIEHNLRRTAPVTDWEGDRAVAWWGPEEKDISSEDLVGFYITSPYPWEHDRALGSGD